jgi:hypothetical protein
MSFDSWLKEMTSRIKIVEKHCGSNGINVKEMELLLDRSIEPYGLWKGNDAAKTAVVANPEETRNALEAAKRKYKLKETGADLKIDGHLEKDKFSECAAFLKGFGYSYDKEIKGFKKGVQ